MGIKKVNWLIKKIIVLAKKQDGLEEGIWTKTDTLGILFVEITYVNGKRIGYFTNRYKNGKLRLKGELEKDGSMKNLKFFDQNGRETKSGEYIIREI